MNRPDTTQRERLGAILDELNAAGSSLIFQFPDGSELGCGDALVTRVCFRDGEAMDAILRGDHPALADAFLQERVDVQGSLRDVIRVTDQLDVEPDRFGALAF